MTQKTEREAFEAHPQFKYMDFDRDKDAWGRGKYKHSHIQALWEGWQSRARVGKGEVANALQECLDSCDGVEINPSNYNHDDVCNLNNKYVEMFGYIEKAIAALSAQAKPVEVGVLVDVMNKVIYNLREGECWRKECAQAILARYNVSEKGE
jgi:hypothetical protein